MAADTYIGRTSSPSEKVTFSIPMMGDLKWKSKEMEEFRRKVIEAKVRLVLGLKPDEDIRKANDISASF